MAISPILSLNISKPLYQLLEDSCEDGNLSDHIRHIFNEYIFQPGEEIFTAIRAKGLLSLKLDPEQSRRLRVRLPEGDLEAIDKLAVTHNVTRTALLRAALARATALQQQSQSLPNNLGQPSSDNVPLPLYRPHNAAMGLSNRPLALGSLDKARLGYPL